VGVGPGIGWGVLVATAPAPDLLNNALEVDEGVGVGADAGANVGFGVARDPVAACAGALADLADGAIVTGSGTSNSCPA